MLHNRKCRSTTALCSVCGGLLRLGEREYEVKGYGWLHSGCLAKLRDLAKREPEPEMSWHEVYKRTEPGNEERKLAFARYLADRGRPTPGRQGPGRA